MIPPAVAEQQAKLGVSAEESKADRLKRQQARFRDRGGAFVPSTTNPLVHVLLARTVSGESPTKTDSKDAPARRVSPRKPRRTSPIRRAAPATIAQESQAIVGSFKTKKAPSRKGKGKAIEPREPTTKPPSQGRGTKRGRKKTEDQFSDVERPAPATTKSKPASKGKGKRRTASSTSDGNPKPRSGSKTKGKTNATKVVVEVLDSDEDQVLVEVPCRAKSIQKKKIQYDDDGETDDDAPIISRQTARRVKASSAMAVRVKLERITAAESSVKELEDREERSQDERRPRLGAKKRGVRRNNDDDDDIVILPTKKGKKSTASKATAVSEPEPAPHLIKVVKGGKTAKHTSRKGKAEPDRHFIEAKQDDESLPKPEPKKRKKEEDNHDDRPRKAVKFAETGITHPSSKKLKENQSNKKCDRMSKSGNEDDADTQQAKLSTNPRAKTPKGPPIEVLQRIKASAARHLRCVDGEPDELDCLS